MGQKPYFLKEKEQLDHHPVEQRETDIHFSKIDGLNLMISDGITQLESEIERLALEESQIQ